MLGVFIKIMMKMKGMAVHINEHVKGLIIGDNISKTI
jgi:hypothetical protein